MFLIMCLVLLLGYPVAFSLAGTAAFLFAGLGTIAGVFDSSLLSAVPSKDLWHHDQHNPNSCPIICFLGRDVRKITLSRSLLSNMAKAFGRQKGGLAYAVIIVGMLLAASTGIVGATVVTMGLMSLPTMLKQNYEPSLATGTICATGTLGQIIPPSIALVLLGDILSSSYQQAQLDMGIFSPKTVSVGDLFVGALIPGLMLVALYLLYAFIATRKKLLILLLMRLN